MLLFKSVWIWIHSVLWPSYSYESELQKAQFQVIGAGLSRTGTFSTRIALTTLLGGKCYHGYVASLDGEPQFWDKAAKGQLAKEDWKYGLEGRGYTAGVGEPVNLFYPEILKVFPEAKVVLTVRPVEEWIDSMKKAIIEPRSYLERPPIIWIFRFFGIAQAKESMADVRQTMADKWGFRHGLWSAVEAGDQEAAEYYHTWNNKVIESVPTERLLIYNVKQGWKPLAKFLNVSEPHKIPFPSINDANTISVVVKGGYYLLMVGIPVSLTFLACLSFKLNRRRMNILKIFTRWKV